jgi:hypothetical protein
MMQHMPFLDPDMMLAMNRYFFVVSVLLALLITFFALVALKAQNGISASWVSSFIPLFIVLGLAFITMLLSLFSSSQNPESELPEPPFWLKLYQFAKLSLFFSFVVLIPLRLDEIIRAKWAMIFIPLLIYCAFNLLELCASAKFVKDPVFVGEEGEDQRFLTFGEKVVALASHFAFSFYTILFAVLLVIKLDNPNGMHWAVVFLPFWIWGFTQVCQIVYVYYAMRLAQVPQTPETKASFYGQVFALVIVGAFVYSSVGLLIQRLEAGGVSPSMPVIFIPVFIILGILFCCTCCCLPMAVGAAKADLHNEMTSTTETIVPVERRVTEEGA